jgi:hypothetical protein
VYSRLYSYLPTFFMTHLFDGDDDDHKKDRDTNADEPSMPGDPNLGDDIGTQVGQGHDTIEDPIT